MALGMLAFNETMHVRLGHMGILLSVKLRHVRLPSSKRQHRPWLHVMEAVPAIKCSGTGDQAAAGRKEDAIVGHCSSGAGDQAAATENVMVAA